MLILVTINYLKNAVPPAPGFITSHQSPQPAPPPQVPYQDHHIAGRPCFSPSLLCIFIPF